MQTELGLRATSLREAVEQTVRCTTARREETFDDESQTPQAPDACYRDGALARTRVVTIS